VKGAHGNDLNWAKVALLLTPARNYWLGTTNGDGSPHVAPVWGVVQNAQFYVYTERTTRKARNLSRDSRAVVHLESAEEVVLVHGRLDDIGQPRDTPAVIRALCDKYISPRDSQYLPSGDEAFDVLYVLRPDSALSWSLADYDGTQLRWVSSRDPARPTGSPSD
jgi:hypothetical protein